jgi:hypothetical protein
MRYFWRVLWTWSVIITGDSRLTLWLEERYGEQLLRDWGCL